MSGGQSEPLLCAPADKPALEARNGAEQLDYITQLVDAGAVSVRQSHVLQLHRLAVQDVYPCAGRFRNALKRVVITNSPHTPPEPAFVTTHVTDALDRINDRGRSALDRAAYALWRFNWIHPFAGGNGRTSRAIAYLILCMDSGAMLPGVPTVPTLIYEERDEYIAALRAADASVSNPSAEPDVRTMAEFLRRMLVAQLASAIDRLARPAPGHAPQDA